MSQKEIQKLVHYDPTTGVFTWKERGLEHFPNERIKKIWNTKFAGKQVGSKTKFGYFETTIKGVKWLLHRLAWFYVHGKLPEDNIDHKNQDKSDTRIDNLRDATESENMKNRKLSSNNESGQHGVWYHKRNQKWIVNTYHEGKTKYHGSFDNKEEAIMTRKKLEKELDFSVNHGKEC